jgi:hypothetical protein
VTRETTAFWPAGPVAEKNAPLRYRRSSGHIFFRATRRTALLVLGATLAVLAAGCGGAASQSEKDQAVAAAQKAYTVAKGGGTDLSSGPCVSEQLPEVPDWVADIAHDPRQPIDDQAANQCQRFRAGQAHHFVELAPDGRLIRAE